MELLQNPPSVAAPATHYSSRSRSRSRTILSDRFIPLRSSSRFALFDCRNTLASLPATCPIRESVPGTYDALLRDALFGSSVKANIFRFKTETSPPLPFLPPFRLDDSMVTLRSNHSKSARLREIRCSSPSMTLGAPGLRDDFYGDLVDWSSRNVIAAGLMGNSVYLYNARDRVVTKLCDLGQSDRVSSVGWDQRGTHLAVGTANGTVQIWDASQCKNIRTMEGHKLRVGALAWSSSMLSSGAEDATILQRDIRSQNDFVTKLTGHESYVCGLKWSYDDRELASGGFDDKLFVWNKHKTKPVHEYTDHKAAVKAIAWSPHQDGLLASGGGLADKCIRFWNTTTNSRLGCVYTGSQVCKLAWAKTVNEVVSTHGYPTDQIMVWNYPAMTKLATLTGHTSRVHYLAMSPNGQTIVTGAADETLNLWDIFPSSKSRNFESEPGFLSFGRAQIR